MGHMASSSSFLKKPMVLGVDRIRAPRLSPNSVSMCPAGLRMMAGEPLGRTVTLLLTWETSGGMAAPKALVWSSNEWAGSEDASSLEYYEQDVGNLALEVVGQSWSSEVISLSLEDWEVGRVSLSCHLSIDLI